MTFLPQTLAVGQTLHARYTIQEMVAQGGMSTIYRAVDRDLPGPWAIKQMAPLQARADDLAEIRAQFRQEAEILARLRHPGVPRVIDCFREDDVDYLVEEYVDGTTLEHTLETHGALTEFEATRIALALLDILAYLHTHRIVYRDMKPGNVMLTTDHRVVLIDFGISRLYTPGKSADTIVVGTPGFASPEHYGRGQTDERSDIFSLGATLHQMLTGRDPSDAPFAFQPPARLVPGVSTSISDLVMRAIDLDPTRRYQSAHAMREALTATQKKPPPRLVFDYPRFVGLPDPVVWGGSVGSFFAGLLATAADPHALLLLPAWLAALGVGGLLRGRSLRGVRVAIEHDGLSFIRGDTETMAHWEDISRIRIHRTSGINRTLVGSVRVYPSSVEITTTRGPFVVYPALREWETLVEWTVYRAGLRLLEGRGEGADEVYGR